MTQPDEPTLTVPVAALGAFYDFYRTYMYNTGGVEPCEKCQADGAVTMWEGDDVRRMEEADLAVEPWEGHVAALLEPYRATEDGGGDGQ